MRVLHVVPGVAARYGGPSQAVFDLCRAVAPLGVETLIATTDADGPRRLPVERERTIRYQGTDVIFFRRDWSESFKYSRRLGRWLGAGAGEFDVVHVHAVFSHSSLAAARACRRRGVPYLVRPLGSLAAWSLRRHAVRKRIARRLGVDRMLGGAACLHYTSARERREAEAVVGGRDRGIVIPLAVDLDTLDGDAAAGGHPAAGGRPYVLAMGRLHPKKRLELLIDAFLEATKAADLLGWKLLVAGDGEHGYADRLRVRAGGSERVVFTGWLAGAEKRAALRGAALLASTSHQENFGLAAVEALGCGVPVLLGDDIDLAEEAEAAACGWTAELEPARLRATLAAVLRSADERRRRGENGRAWVRERFGYEAVGAALAACYRRIAEHAA